MKEGYSLSRSRRVYPRFKVDSFGFLKREGVVLPILIRDISSQGAGVISKMSLERGALVEVSGDLSLFNFYLSTQGRVVYCLRETENLFRMGIDFGFRKIVLAR